MNIADTSWAKRFKVSEPHQYATALDYASVPNLEVGLIRTNEATGDVFMWVVSTHDNFWLDSFATEEEARALCAEMGWKITKVYLPYG